MPNSVVDQLADLREKHRSILEEAQKEKRNFTDEEQKNLNLINQQIRFLKDELDLQDRKERGLQRPESELEMKLRFVRGLAEAVNENRSLSLSLRSSDFMETTNHGIDGTIPLQYKDVIHSLEKGLVLNRVGCTIETGIHGDLVYPYMDTLEASFLGETEEVQFSQLNFTSIKTSPKRISASVPVSRLAIHQSNVSLYDKIHGELGMSIARKLNHTVFSPTSNGVLDGPFVNLASTNTQQTASFTHESLVGLEHLVLDNMLDAMSPKSCYVLNSRTALALKTTPKVKGQSEMLLQESRGADGQINAYINGFPALYCNYVPEGTIYFGDFRWLTMAQFDDITLMVDPYTLSRRGSIYFVINTHVDIVKVRKEAFASLVKG